MSNEQEVNSLGQGNSGSAFDGRSRDEIFDFSNDSPSEFLKKNWEINTGVYFNKDNLLELTGEIADANQLGILGMALKHEANQVDQLLEVLKTKSAEMQEMQLLLEQSWKGFAGEYFQIQFQDGVNRAEELIRKTGEMSGMIHYAIDLYSKAYDEALAKAQAAKMESER